jgi:hypothetical protein
MSASVVHGVPLFVSDHRVLLGKDAQAVLEPMAPGSTEIARVSGLPGPPYRAGYRLLKSTFAVPGASLAAAIATTVAWHRTQAKPKG